MKTSWLFTHHKAIWDAYDFLSLNLGFRRKHSGTFPHLMQVKGDHLSFKVIHTTLANIKHDLHVMSYGHASQSWTKANIYFFFLSENDWSLCLTLIYWLRSCGLLWSCPNMDFRPSKMDNGDPCSLALDGRQFWKVFLKHYFLYSWRHIHPGAE